jgi:hypothetical protein
MVCARGRAQVECRRSASRRVAHSQVPRVPLPGAGVTAAGMTSCVISKGVTPSSSLVRTHVPIHGSPSASVGTSCGGSLQVVASPCWVMDLPDVISASPSSDVWTSSPAAHEVLMLVSSLVASAFPSNRVGRRMATSCPSDFEAGASFRARSHSLMFRPPSLLAIQVAPTFAFPRGGSGVVVRAEHASLPSHASDQLAVRFEQFTTRGLAPLKTRSLVGCSPLLLLLLPRVLSLLLLPLLVLPLPMLPTAADRRAVQQGPIG